MTHPGGRPTEYTPELLEKAREYIGGAYTDNDELLPTVAGLAMHMNIARSTIYEWASQEDKPEFSDILEAVLTIQEKRLVNKGLSGDFNSAITKMMLTKHGYSDKLETDITTKGQSLNTNTEAEKAAAEAYAATLKPKE